MPELPETETIARDLEQSVRGSVIANVTVRSADVLREVTASVLRRDAPGYQIARVWRRAKLVVLNLNRPQRGHSDTASHAHLVVHPRFTGALLVDDGTLDPTTLNYLALTFQLQDSRLLHYRDVRRLGTVALMTPERFAEYSAAIGPEPLDDALDERAFSALVRSSRKQVKAFLMDQRKLAGVGNIYANEALWRAGIDPSRIAASIPASEAATLLRELRAVLSASIAARGTSFRDYRDARGERGAFVAQLAVYGRGGQPCLRCNRTLVETHAVDGRTTVFCAQCQR